MLIQCQCGQQYNIKESMYGKVVRCKKCGVSLQIGYPEQTQPAPAPAPAPPQQQAYPQAGAQYPPAGHPPAQYPPAAPQQPAGVYDPNALPANQGMAAGQPPYAQSPYGAAPYGGYASQAVPGPRPKPKQIKYDFSKVHTGLRLIFAGTVVSILAMFAGVGFIYAGVPSLAVVMNVVSVLGNLMSAVGYIMCIFVPVETMARPLIIGAVVCSSLNFLVAISAAFIPPAASQLLGLLGFGVMIFTTLAMTLFLLFLRKVAEFVENSGAAHDAHSLLVFYWGLIGAIFGFVIFFIPVAMTGLGILVLAYMLVGLLGMLVGWIVWFVHFMGFISSVEFKRTSATRRRKKY